MSPSGPPLPCGCNLVKFMVFPLCKKCIVKISYYELFECKISKSKTLCAWMSSNFSQIFTSFTRFSSKLANTKCRNSSRHRILAVSIKLVILKISITVGQLSRKKNYILLVRKTRKSKWLIKNKNLVFAKKKLEKLREVIRAKYITSFYKINIIIPVW